MEIKKWLGLEQGTLPDHAPRRSYDDLLEQVMDPEFQARRQQEAEAEAREEEWESMPDLPIPHSLWELVRTTREQCTEHSAQGTLVCTCGCEHWKVEESNHRRMVRLVCPECRASYVIYDAGRMGWDAMYAARDYMERREPWQPVECRECGRHTLDSSQRHTFLVRFALTNPGRKAFLRALHAQDPGRGEGHLLSERREAADWVDAFDRFRLELECHDGGHVLRDWLIEDRAGGPAGPDKTP